MVAVVINHGTGGSPEENWFLWLRRHLEEDGHKVLVPRYPRPEHQSLSSWSRTFVEEVADLSPSIVVGHSTGVALSLNLLSRAVIKPARTFKRGVRLFRVSSPS